MTNPAQMAQAEQIVLALTTLEVGESMVFPWASVHAFSSYRKQKARELLNNPDAVWSARSLNRGVRVTRVK